MKASINIDNEILITRNIKERILHIFGKHIEGFTLEIIDKPFTVGTYLKPTGKCEICGKKYENK